MGKRIVKPEAYRMKTRSRAGMREAVLNLTTVHEYPVSFNVKVRNVGLSFEHLLSCWVKYEGKAIKDPRWLKEAAARYEEHEDNLWDWGLEGARRAFEDEDTFRMLWDGTELQVEYGFSGRSGGWLVILEFEGHMFERRWDKSELWLCLNGMPMRDLSRLYQLCLMLAHDLTPDRRKDVVEQQAAFDFFANICGDIHSEQAVQLDLFDPPEVIAELAIAGQYPDDDDSPIVKPFI